MYCTAFTTAKTGILGHTYCTPQTTYLRVDDLAVKHPQVIVDEPGVPCTRTQNVQDLVPSEHYRTTRVAVWDCAERAVASRAEAGTRSPAVLQHAPLSTSCCWQCTWHGARRGGRGVMCGCVVNGLAATDLLAAHHTDHTRWVAECTGWRPVPHAQRCAGQGRGRAWAAEHAPCAASYLF